MKSLRHRRWDLADKKNSKIGYGKPPKHTQFVKGKSGNPKGRPKGSQNLATLLEKIIRQRVTVTENGRSREMSKAEAIFIQMVNKALRGDLSATHELRFWSQWLEDSAKAAAPSPVLHDDDKAVMASIVERARQAENPPSNNLIVPEITDRSQGEK
jgi:Family of unknown function (DUF5681)